MVGGWGYVQVEKPVSLQLSGMDPRKRCSFSVRQLVTLLTEQAGGRGMGGQMGDAVPSTLGPPQNQATAGAAAK